jgi:hypothetical protein
LRLASFVKTTHNLKKRLGRVCVLGVVAAGTSLHPATNKWTGRRQESLWREAIAWSADLRMLLEQIGPRAAWEWYYRAWQVKPAAVNVVASKMNPDTAALASEHSDFRRGCKR